MMHGNKLCAVRESAFHLNIGDHLGYAGHHLIPPEKTAAEVHEFGHGMSVTDELKQLSGNKRDALWIVQPKAAREALLRQRTGVVQKQLVEFTGGEMHTSPFPRPRVVKEQKFEER